jgi:HK97 family phage prohead protease
MRTREKRGGFTTEFETRTLADGTFQLEGHAAVFNRHSQDLGGFVEQVDHRAFNQTLKNNPDTRALFNHNPLYIIGRTRAGTLDMATDATGLHYRVRMGDRSYERDLRESMERRDIDQSSFAFWTIDDEWSRTESGMPLRTLKQVSLNEGDVSPVTFPAYLDADSGVRAATRSLADELGHDIEPGTIAAALDEIASRSSEAGSDDDVQLEEEAPATATPLSVVHARMLLELKRRAV